MFSLQLIIRIQHMLDILLTIGTFGTFVIFAICIWLIKREKDKAKRAKDPSEHDTKHL
ncbi:MAG: hypothetical protein JWQ71_2206 [Pedosphaera sp.]|nr:hypothetical protein [Pedosphaera sp.]